MCVCVCVCVCVRVRVCIERSVNGVYAGVRGCAANVLGTKGIKKRKKQGRGQTHIKQAREGGGGIKATGVRLDRWTDAYTKTDGVGQKIQGDVERTLRAYRAIELSLIHI